MRDSTTITMQRNWTECADLQVKHAMLWYACDIPNDYPQYNLAKASEYYQKAGLNLMSRACAIALDELEK